MWCVNDEEKKVVKTLLPGVAVVVVAVVVVVAAVVVAAVAVAAGVAVL